jgi:hypothetical protein
MGKVETARGKPWTARGETETLRGKSSTASGKARPARGKVGMLPRAVYDGLLVRVEVSPSAKRVPNVKQAISPPSHHTVANTVALVSSRRRATSDSALRPRRVAGGKHGAR